MSPWLFNVYMRIYILNNQGDITQPCFYPTLTRKPTQPPPTINNFPSTPYTFSICHIPCQSIVSHAFCKSINAQNTSFSFAIDTFHTPAKQQTLDS